MKSADLLIPLFNFSVTGSCQFFEILPVLYNDFSFYKIILRNNCFSFLITLR